MRAFTLAQGRELVKAARHTIELYIRTPQFKKGLIGRRLEEFTQKHGTFVTILHYPTRTLRGCMGFAEPIGPVKELLIDAAIAASTEDPRFVPISHYELDDMVIEVSLLSKPELLEGDLEEIKKQIKIGRDGLIVEYGYYKGLLLPVVAVEEHWTVDQFLDNVCIKAGMDKHVWKQGGVTLWRFTTHTFREKSPNGDIEEAQE